MSTIYYGTSNWVSHMVLDGDGDPIINLQSDDFICQYWNKIMEEFSQKSLDSDNCVAIGEGEYRVLYEREEIALGPHISLIIPSITCDASFDPSISINTAVSTVSGTCIVSGQLIDLSGQPITYPVEIVIENIYNPIVTNLGGVVIPSQKFYSDITGYIEMPLLPGAKVRIGISCYGIVRTVTIPENSTSNLFDLLETAEDEFEPI